MAIEIIRADIATLAVDCIVNAANTRLAGGGGVDGAIHRAAGPELLVESLKLAPCPVGRAILTRGYALPAKYVIHAVGPIWSGGKRGEAELLTSAYRASFELARKHQLQTIAFPAISTGAYGYPKEDAARIALRIMQQNQADFARVIACPFDFENERIYQEQLEALLSTVL